MYRCYVQRRIDYSQQNQMASDSLQFNCFYGNDTLKVLFLVPSEDEQLRALRGAADNLGAQWDWLPLGSSKAVMEEFTKNRHKLVFIDRREPSLHVQADSMVHNLRAYAQYHCLVVAITPSCSSNSVSFDMETLLKLGYDRRFCENTNVNHCVDELVMMQHNDVTAICQRQINESLKQALNQTAEAVEVTNNEHKILFINQAHERLLGRSIDDVRGKCTWEIYQRTEAESADDSKAAVVAQLEKGSTWRGHMCSSHAHGQPVQHKSEIFPIMEADSASAHNYVSVLRRLSEARKSSIDASNRRVEQPPAKNNVKIEPGITKVVNALKALQSSLSGENAEILDDALDILTSTDLYSADIGVNEDPATHSIVDGLLTSSKSSDKANNRKSSAVLRRSSAPRPSEILTEHIRQVLDSRTQHGHQSLADIPDEIVRVMESEPKWEFDIFSLEEVTNMRPLVYLSMKILDRFNVIEYLKCSELTLRNWLQVIEDNYHAANPYHNSTHAADVLQCAAYFLDRETVKEVLTDEDEVSALLSAIVHDLDHPGRTNAFLSNSRDRIAVLYNDKAVLENHHISLAFQLTVKDDRINIFKNLDRKSYQGLRELLVEQVLATEMVKHYEHVAKFVNKITPVIEADPNPVSWVDKLQTADNRSVIRCMLIKCSDVSNPLRPFHLCERWAHRICEEYFNQTEEENKLGLPNSMAGFDRRTCVIPNTQTAFIGVLRNMFEAWDKFARLTDVLPHLELNIKKWNEVQAATVAAEAEAAAAATATATGDSAE